jgi:hypothetical protein
VIARPSPGAGGRLGLAALLLLVAAHAALTAPASAAEERPAPAPITTRIRAMDPRAGALLEMGASRSPTIRQLIAVLEESDVVIQVETSFLGHPARTAWIGASPTARFLRITLDVPEMDDRLLAWLGHELQHAVEIAQAPAITSHASLLQHYRRIGFAAVGAHGMCSTEAQRVTVRVRVEIAKGLAKQ